jgi:UDPglucose 6-dehydrogenase
LDVGKSTVPSVRRPGSPRPSPAPPSRSRGTRSSCARACHRQHAAPDRLVFGVTPDPAGAAAEALLRRIYATPIAAGTPVAFTDPATAELVKVAANAFLTTKISFINAMAEVCEAAGADVVTLAAALGHDDRIGPKFIRAGSASAAAAYPKDMRAFMARAGELGADQPLTFLREVDAINMRRRSKVVALPRQACGGSFIGRRLAILGAAFKPHSDDIRDSPRSTSPPRPALQGADVVVMTRRPSTMPAPCGPT